MKSPVELHSPKQVARALGVSESSLKRWCDDGVIKTTRTAGGHRKVQTSDVIQFARKRGMTFVTPEILGLPPAGLEAEFSTGAKLLAESLLAGNDFLSRQLVLNLAFNGQALASLFDDVIAAAFVEIGERWACQQADVYQERRACETVLQILAEISKSLSTIPSTLTACGGTVTGNSYSLQTAMAEIVLRDCGYSAKSLGTEIPFDSLVRAAHDLRPNLFWLSAAYIADEAAFLGGIVKLSAACSATQCTLVIGGRALTPSLREQIPDATYCENMQQLVAFARSLARVHERSLAAESQVAHQSKNRSSSSGKKRPKTSKRKKHES